MIGKGQKVVISVWAVLKLVDCWAMVGAEPADALFFG